MIRIRYNGKDITTDSVHVFDLTGESRDHYVVVNGFSVRENVKLNDGDSIFRLRKDEKPDREILKELISARDPAGIRTVLCKARVGIAGLGGLGSNIAMNLARSGVGTLVIADFDTVDATNLNRQNYTIDDIGKRKTDATAESISKIAPYVKVESHSVFIDENNAADIFGDCDVLCEAFDTAENKAMLINVMLENRPNVMVISGSGMAGYGDSNSVITERRFNGLYICGDGKTEASSRIGLTSPRVTICAGHMANKAVEYLVDEK